MLRQLIYILIGIASLCCWAGQSWAGQANFDYLPAQSATEKEFKKLMQDGNFRQAMMTWETTHQASDFGHSANGVATWSYIAYQSGLPYLALENLLHNTQPGQLNVNLLSLWETEIKKSPFIQKGWIKTVGKWQNISSNEIPSVKLTKKSDIEKAFARATALKTDQGNAKARIWWQIATKAPQINEVDPALKALKLISESGQTVISPDQVAMAQGRVLYQKGDLEAALKAYALIPKNSIIWTEAVEERAWTHLRGKDYDRALGVITTALSPVLNGIVGPESYYLANLMSLKVCDYPRIFKNSETFKTRHRKRLGELQDLASKGVNSGMPVALARMEKSGVNLEAVGVQVESIPRAAFRDVTFTRAMESRRQLLAEKQKASQLAADSESLGGGQNLNQSLALAQSKAEKFKQLAISRVRVLAQEELKEYRINLNKMHIIEAEVIQRLHVDERLKGERPKLAKTDDKGDVLVFPYGSDEVWMDELDNYQARVKDCPELKGASL